MAKKRPGVEFLLKVATAIQRELEETGIQSKDARKVALRVVEMIRHENGGTEVYIPKGVALTLIQRDWQIWEEFDGTNYSALAREYQLTTRQIRRVIVRCRKEKDLKPTCDQESRALKLQV